MRNLIYFIIIAVVLFTSSCVPVTKTVSSKNLSSLYNPSESYLHPLYFVYTESDSRTLLYTHFLLSDLLFLQIESDKAQKAKVKFEYKIYPSFKNNKLVDSMSRTMDIVRKYNKKSVIFSMDIKDDTLQRYIVHVRGTDLLRKKMQQSFLTVDRTNSRSSQNFFVALTASFTPYFSQYFRSSTNYLIKNERNKPSHIFVKYYAQPFNPAAPPFSSFNASGFSLIPDSIEKIDYDNGIVFNGEKKGLYLFQVDTAYNEGLARGVFSDYYPYVKKSEDLLGPLQYLTSTEEFNALNVSENKKLSIDNFWLKSSGSYDHSREIIRIFYNRVTFANLYFATYKQGWKSDRGMIYIVFGPPKVVYKTIKGEKWIYSDNRNYKTITFEFDRTKNSFSGYDYILQRSINYKSSWYRAVDTWRNGKVYSFP